MDRFGKTACCKKLRTLVLAAILCLGVTACGGKDGNGENPGNGAPGIEDQGSGETGGRGEAPSNLVYQPEEIQLAAGGEYDLHDIQVVGDNLYCMVEQEGGHVLRCQSLTGGGVTDYPMEYPLAWAVGEDGSPYAVLLEESRKEDGEFESKRFLVKWDVSQEEAYRQDVTEFYQPETMFSYALAVDGQGRAYLLSEGAIRLFNAQGEPKGTVQAEEIKGDICICLGRGGDGRVYVTDGNISSVLYAVNYEDVRLEKGQKGLLPGSRRLSCDGYGNFLASDSVGIYRYNAETQECDMLFRLTDTEIPYLYSSVAMGGLSDGRIAVAYSNWEKGDSGVVLMTGVEADEDPRENEKTELIVGVMSTSANLEVIAARFNARSETCHITIKSYMKPGEIIIMDGVNRLQMDIAAGNYPDVIEACNLDWRNLLEKGVLEDLNPYLDGSEALSREDLFENVLDRCSYKGRLGFLPTTLQVQTYVGSGRELGNQESWSIDDVIAFAEAHPGEPLLVAHTPQDYLKYCLRFTMDSFADPDTGECNFDGEEFRRLLEFASSASAYEPDTSYQHWAARAVEGDSLLTVVDMYELWEPQIIYDVYEGDPVCIGQPGPDGTGVNSFYATEGFGLCAQSKNKEEAWAFLETYILEKQPKIGGVTGFPARRSEFEKLAEEAMRLYKLDEEGNPVVNEFGYLVPNELRGDLHLSNGYTYTWHTPIQEEVDLVRSIIETGQMQEKDSPLMNIVLEDAEAYFLGQKSLEETVKVIQNRASLYMSERN